MKVENPLQQNNVDDVVADNKFNNSKTALTTEMRISYNVYQMLDNLLGQIYPDLKEKDQKRIETLEQIIILGIKTKFQTVHQQQLQQCFFVVDGKVPRKDQFENYAKIAFVLEKRKSFPNFGEKFLRDIIKMTTGRYDNRTVNVYMDGITQHSTKKPYESGYNVKTFCKSFSDSFKIKVSQGLDSVD